MELVTIKQFADSQGISYEAVRKQLHKYSEELSGHVIPKDRTRYLDEVAVKFLQERRRESPIILQNMDQGEEISRLMDQVEYLRAQLVSAQNKLLESQERIISLKLRRLWRTRQDIRHFWRTTKPKRRSCRKRRISSGGSKPKEMKLSRNPDVLLKVGSGFIGNTDIEGNYILREICVGGVGDHLFILFYL